VLGAGERADGPEAFYRYWTRKEAVVKATGDGITVDLQLVRVSGVDEPPRLLSYPDRPAIAAAIRDLNPGGGHVAAVCVLTDRAPRVVEHWYTEMAD